MASPSADAPAAAGAPAIESKPRLSPPAPEKKPESNSPSASESAMKPIEVTPPETSVASETAPVESASTPTLAVNGSGSSSEHNGTNGVTPTSKPSPEKLVVEETVSTSPPIQQAAEKPTVPATETTTIEDSSEKSHEVVSSIKPIEDERVGEMPMDLSEESPKPEPERALQDSTKEVDESAKPVVEPSAIPTPVTNEPFEKTVAEHSPVAESTKIENIVIAAPKEPEDIDMKDAPAVPQESSTDSKTAELPVSSLQTQDSAAPPTSEVDLQPVSMSQLNIETQPNSSPVVDSVEVFMPDAPPKIAREREDDDLHQEPAPKRAKTEPEEDKSQAEQAQIQTAEPQLQAAPAAPAAEQNIAMVDAAPAEQVPSLDTLPRWQDLEANNTAFSTYQRREIRKTIGRLKKTKGGGNFRDAVVKLWPQLREAYLAKIEKPMDLSELDRNVRDGEGAYATFGNFKDAASLIFANTVTFNGPTHDITLAAFNVVRTLWEDLLAIPADEPPTRPKAAQKVKPPRESRAVANAEAAAAAAAANAAARRQSTAPRGSPATDMDIKSVAGQGSDRRGSTATEGDRPKRTVRAPKPKDIDYTPKPSRKKLKPELQFASEVLTEVMHPKHERLNMWFLEPVDAEGLNIPNYYSIIKKPMDLGKISRMLSAGEFSNLKDFDKHVRLIFENCYSFNGPPSQGNPVSGLAAELEGVYTSQMKTKDAWLAKFAKANAPTSADVSDDDEEEEADDTASVEDNSKEIQELGNKLAEETKKLHAMFVPGANQSMIEIQRGIVDMVEKALMKAVSNAGESQAKNEKAAKKAKTSKSKKSGGRKSVGGGASGKKASGGKKGSGKRSLTAADKDHIANAINDLENPHLDKAIDIIKRDTGQNENNDGELELDIDQLSNDALLKLWDLCKKVLPGFAKDSAGPTVAPEPSRASKPKTTAGKPKKNKPMSAQEQEARIAQLTALRQMYKDGAEPSDAAGAGAHGSAQSPPLADSSDDSDSEEE